MEADEPAVAPEPSTPEVAPTEAQAAPDEGAGEDAAGDDDPGEGLAEVDADPGLIFDKIDGWVDGFFRLLPNIAVALILMAIFVALGIGVAWALRRAGRMRGRENLGQVGGNLVKWVIYVLGFMLGATIVVPSLKPGDLIAGLGIGSVAIGFAFKDILQNLLAGILLLVRQPFEIGDQIVSSGGFEGTVERIETRATLIRTYDGKRVVIPNSEIYTNAVTVKTAYAQTRSQYDVGIGYGDDWDEAIRLAREAAAGVEGVLADPAPEALAWALDESAKVVRVRWWTASPRADVVEVWSGVLRAVSKAYDEAGIDMPFPTQVHLFHDQTEEVDGRRGRQREGWPAAGRDVPAARWDAERREQAVRKAAE